MSDGGRWTKRSTSRLVTAGARRASPAATVRVPRWVYLGLPFVWVAGIPLGTLGGGLIAGAYWLAVGYLLADRSLETRRPAVATV